MSTPLLTVTSGDTRPERSLIPMADLCRRRRWGPGTRLTATFVPTPVEVTAVGAQAVLVRPVTDAGTPDGDEMVVSVTVEDWWHELPATATTPATSDELDDETADAAMRSLAGPPVRPLDRHHRVVFDDQDIPDPWTEDSRYGLWRGGTCAPWWVADSNAHAEGRCSDGWVRAWQSWLVCGVCHPGARTRQDRSHQGAPPPRS